MNNPKQIVRVGLLTLLLLMLSACGSSAFSETFDDTGSWGVGQAADVSGAVTGGVYDFYVESSRGSFWSTAGQNLADGTYTVEATQIDGPVDNGYGMIFNADMDQDNFYLFEVSSDGYVWIGRCEAGCQEETVLVDRDWFASDAIRQGVNETNTLRVDVLEGDMVFYVNGLQVGRAFDNTYSSGDVGVFVETIGEGGLRVHFDNYDYTPAE